VLAEYVWVDAVGSCRSKTRTLPASKAKSVETIPKWNFDGSSTGQAPGDDSEVILRPCRIFKDPFRPRTDGVDNILVMCDTYTPLGQPLPSNTRYIGKIVHSTFLSNFLSAHLITTKTIFLPPLPPSPNELLLNICSFVCFQLKRHLKD
jgi:glutamine synthetase